MTRLGGHGLQARCLLPVIRGTSSPGTASKPFGFQSFPCYILDTWELQPNIWSNF